MRNKILFGMFFALIFIGCGALDSPVSVDSSSSIKGVVTDNNGDPLAGVTISTTPTTLSVSTNASGEYEIPDVEEGNYQISGNKSAYKNNKTTVNVVAGQTAQANLTLEKVVPELQVSAAQLFFGTTSNTMQLTLTITPTGKYGSILKPHTEFSGA